MRVNLLIRCIFLFSCLFISRTVAAACTQPPVPSISTSGPLTFCSGQSVTLTATAGAGYSYQWKKDGINISGATNISYVASVTGSYTVMVTVDTCSNTSLPKDVIVNPNPNGSLTANHSICQGTSTTLVAGGGTSYNWSASGASGNTLTVTPGVTTNYSVTITNNNGCSDVKSVQVSVQPLPLASVSVAGPSTLCDGESVNLNASTGMGYTYQWYRNNVPVSGATTSQLTVNSTGDYHVVVTLNGCSKTSSPKTITVNPLPAPVVSNDATICSGDSITLQASGGTAYQWSSGGPATAAYTVAPTSTKTYTVTVTNSYNCTASESVTVTVKPLPNANISLSGSATLCIGQSVTLNASNGTGYTYQWYKNNALLSGETDASLTVNTSGSYKVAVDLNGCPRTSSTQVITVNPVPVPVVSRDTTVCSGASVTMTASGGTAYQWSSGGPASASFTVVPTATKTYTVTVTNSFGCTASANVVITVKPLPNANISTSGSTTICSGQSVTLNASAGAGYSYQWRLNFQPIPGANSQSFVASAGGNYQVITTLNGCSRESFPTAVTVNPVPVPVVSSDATICAGDTLTLHASGGTAYQWSGGGPATADYTVAPSSTKTYTVTVTNSYNCTASAGVTITAKPLPNANMSLSGSTTLCSGQSVMMTVSNGTGYSHQWYKNNVLLTGETNPSLTVNSAGDYYATVTLDGCSKKSAKQTIVVNPVPLPVVNGDVTICAGDTAVLEASGGTAYQWNSGGPATATYAVAPASTKTYTVTVSNSFNCTASAHVTVTVKPLPNANISATGGTAICTGQSLTLTASNGTGYSHQWYKNNVLLNGETNPSLVVNSAGNYHVMVSLNGCNKISAVQNITVNSLPIPQVSNDTTVCSGASVTMHASGGTAYQWSYGGPPSSDYTVAPTSTKTYTVTVTNSSGCTASAGVTITVLPLPQVWLSAAGFTTLCQGQSVTLNTANTAGYTHKWFKDGSLIPGAAAASYIASSAGQYFVINTFNGCSDTSSAIPITVNSLPVTAITNDLSVCSGDTVTLTATGGISYEWNTGPVASSITVTVNSTRTYTVTITDGNGCSVQESVTVTSVALPNTSVSLSGPTTFCADKSLTMTASSGSGYSYQWYKNNLAIPGATQAALTVNQTGMYLVRVSVNGCSKNSNMISVTVNPLPVVTVSNNSTICAGDTIQLYATGGTAYNWSNGSTSSVIQVSPTINSNYSVTVSNTFGCNVVKSITVSTISRPNAVVSPGGTISICSGQTATLTANSGTGLSYQWMQGTSILNGQISQTLTVSAPGSYYVMVTANGCPKKSNTVQVNVNPLPVVLVSNDATICSGTPVTLSAAGGSTYKWSTGSTNQNITVTPNVTTAYHVTVTTSFGCSATGDVVVSVLPSPNANVISSGPLAICLGDSVTLNASTGASYTYQWKNNGVDIAGETSSSLVATQSGYYSVVVSALGCAKTSAVQAVTVNLLPTAVVSNDVTICRGDSVDLIASGGTSYRWSNGRITAMNTVSPNQTTTYQVTVTDVNGCADTGHVSVNVIPLPNAFITTSSSTNICAGQTVTLNASSGTGYSYEWYQNGNLLPGAGGSSYVASQTGSYTVKTTVNGCSKTSLPVGITVNSFLTATISSDTTICAGDTVTITATGGGSYDWNTGDTTATIIAAPVSTKTYSVTVSNGINCSAVKSMVVTVKPLPNAIITVGGGVSGICEGKTVVMNANTGAGLSYQWMKNSADITGANSSQYIAGDSGSYTVKVTLNGCSKISSPKTITVNPLPVIWVSRDTAVCTGSSVTLSVRGGVSYQWNTFSGDSNYTVSPGSSKTYSVTATNSHGCTATDTVRVTTLPLPTNVFISSTSSTSICEGQSVHLKAGSTNGTEFQWQLDDVDIAGANSNEFEATQQGNYSLVVSGNGCSKKSSPLFVTVKPAPPVPEIIRIGADSLMSTVTASNYKWFRDGMTVSTGSQKVKATKSGAYTVYVTENNCPSDTSEPYYFYFTGLLENIENEMMVYPNPGDGKFQIILPMSADNEFTITVLNPLGQIIAKDELSNSGTTQLPVDLSGLTPGVYFLNLQFKEKSFISRVVVSR